MTAGAGWRAEPLRDSCLKTELTDPRKQPDATFEYVDVSGVSNESFRIVHATRLVGRQAPSRARKRIRSGDVIFATVRPTLGRVALVPERLDGQVCSTGFCVVRADRSRLEPAFVYYWLLTKHVAQRVLCLQSGATYPAISDSDLLNERLPRPGLPEQRAIAAALRTVQDARDARRRELALERERKEALMEALLFPAAGHGPEGCTPGSPPRGWQLIRLGDVADSYSGGTPSKSRSDWWSGSIPWASPKDIKKPRLNDAQDHLTAEAVGEGSRLAEPGTLFVVVRGMILAKDFPVAMTQVPMAFNQDIRALVPRPGVCGDYLLYLLWQRKAEVQSVIGTSAHGTRRIGSAALESLIVPVPPLPVQRSIAEAMTICDRKIAALEGEAAQLDELFRAMLEELMSGRLSALPLVE